MISCKLPIGQRILLTLLVTSTFSAFTGCDKGPELVEVSGIVRLNGKPLELVHIEFWPDAGPRSLAKTDSQGKFVLELDDRSASGAVPGNHKVSLKDTWPMKDDYLSDGGEWVDKSEGRKSRIDSKYYDAPRSPLSVTVKAGEPNIFDFDVDPRGKK